jgi:hypothetical protein
MLQRLVFSPSSAIMNGTMERLIRNLRDHSPFMQECTGAKAGVKNSLVDQCANKETVTCTD